MGIFNDIKKLGFGLMRLPIRGGKLDSHEFSMMVRAFIGSGYSYFDTAPGYMGGYSEGFFKKHVSDMYNRELFHIATKMPAWDSSRVHSASDVEKLFESSLRNTGVDYFDFYLLHNIGEERTIIFEKYKVWDFVQRCLRNGQVLHYGISFHGKADELNTIITAHPDIEFVQLQINYADWEDNFVEARKCYDVASSQCKPVIVMEPLKGGTLISLPPSFLEIFSRINCQSPAQWAFRWLASLSQVQIILSGMSSYSQMKENIEIFEHLRPLNIEEEVAINEVRSLIDAASFIPCTGCQYCRSSCPQLIPIDQILQALNIDHVYENRNAALNKYRFQTRDGNRASICIKCKKCEKICPQHIEICKFMSSAIEKFE